MEKLSELVDAIIAACRLNSNDAELKPQLMADIKEYCEKNEDDFDVEVSFIPYR